MQRKENETFADYKIRRAISNQAVKDINKNSRGGKGNTRENRPAKGVVSCSYGNAIRMHFAKKNLEKLKEKK